MVTRRSRHREQDQKIKGAIGQRREFYLKRWKIPESEVECVAEDL
jgi:hypothetical protein